MDAYCYICLVDGSTEKKAVVVRAETQADAERQICDMGYEPVTLWAIN